MAPQKKAGNSNKEARKAARALNEVKRRKINSRSGKLMNRRSRNIILGSLTRQNHISNIIDYVMIGF